MTIVPFRYNCTGPFTFQSFQSGHCRGGEEVDTFRSCKPVCFKLPIAKPSPQASRNIRTTPSSRECIDGSTWARCHRAINNNTPIPNYCTEYFLLKEALVAINHARRRTGTASRRYLSERRPSPRHEDTGLDTAPSGTQCLIKNLIIMQTGTMYYRILYERTVCA